MDFKRKLTNDEWLTLHKIIESEGNCEPRYCNNCPLDKIGKEKEYDTVDISEDLRYCCAEGDEDGDTLVKVR